jgi:hypothetical protein
MTQKNKKLLFTMIFALIGFGLMQVPFTKIIGSNLKFTLFDFYGPIAAGFIGSTWGVITILIMQLANWAWQGFNTDTATLIRLLPMIFAALYFAKKSKWILVIPIIAMLAFWVHPEGRAAWYYALYWLIPVAMHFLRDKFLLARALGTTFTAHSVGSVLFLYFLNLKAPIWASLIPVVWKERGLMAIGICVTFIIFNYLLNLATKKLIGWDFLQINKKYLLGQK